MLVYINDEPVNIDTASDLVAMFGLDELDYETLTSIEGKHICVDPYAEDVHNRRVLMWADTSKALDDDYRESCADI